MNILHSYLEFTIERSVERKLPFLNTELKQVLNRLHTNVYRKPFCGLTHTSICQKLWKLGLIKFYLNRALNKYA